MSNTIGTHMPCETCGSSDALARYADGGVHCFSCGYHEHPNKTREFHVTETKDFQDLKDSFQVMSLPSRRISQATCQKYDYYVGNWFGKICQAAVYRDSSGHVCAQKLRFPGKDFSWLGSSKDVMLYGQNLFKPNPKIDVVVTEGEIDALSIAEIQECKWPVVSVPGGAQHAKTAFKNNLAWLKGWKSVIIAFDNDEEGRKAEELCARFFDAGKVKLLRLPLKDANDMLQQGRISELQKAIMNPIPYKPDSIISWADLKFSEVFKERILGLDLHYPMLNNMIRGLHKERLIMFTSGWGMGKSTIMKEIGYHLAVHHGQKVGNIFLEENVEDTILGYVAIDNNLFPATLGENEELARECFDKSHKTTLSKAVLEFHDHKGMIDAEEVLSRIDFMATGLECDFILFDHITHLVSSMEAGKEGDRKIIDMMLIKLKSIIHRTGCGIITSCQLSQSGMQKGVNNGGQAHINKLRGSGQMAAVPDVIVALEGNQQDEEEGHLRRLRILKNRTGSKLGIADTLSYDYTTGRLLPTALSFKDVESSSEVIF